MKRAATGSGCTGGCGAPGFANVVVDSSSIEVNRRRAAGEDRSHSTPASCCTLLRRWAGGKRERLECDPRADARGRSGAAADARARHGARGSDAASGIGSQALLATQGIRCAAHAAFPAPPGRRCRPAMDSRWPAAWQDRLAREWAHLAGDRGAAGRPYDGARRRDRSRGPTASAQVARQLCQLRGVAETSATLFSAELFGTRTFRERPRSSAR